MKNAIIVHGSSCTPDLFWYPAIKKHLESQGYSVWVPQLPDTDNPDVHVQVPFLLEHGTFNEHTVLIGHSAGCPMILALLEKIPVYVARVIFVAGLAKRLDAGDEKFVKEHYNWERIKTHAKQFITINSIDDPWGCDDTQGRFIFEHVGGMQIITHDQGHFGSTTYNQPYKEFPLLEKLL